jgi:CheY-like chemotaxis protein
MRTKTTRMVAAAPALALSVSGLLLLSPGLNSPSASDAFGTEIELSPIRNDPQQAETLRLNAMGAREQFRRRVPLPVAALEPTAPITPATQSALHAVPSYPAGFTSQTQGLVLGGMLALAGMLAWRKLVPHLVLRAEPSADGLADEQAFAEFLPAFKEGPAEPHRDKEKPSPAPPAAASRPSQEQSKPKPDALKPFFASVPEQLLAMWNLLQAAQRDPLPGERQELLGHLARQLCILKYAASIPELLPVWQVASITEGLVLQLTQRAAEVTANRLHWVDQGLGLLADLCQPGLAPELSSTPPIRLLAVDDDLISRRAVASSLRKAFKPPDLAANGEAALAQISTIQYDVIFLDILMPGLDGFELLSRIRQQELNRLTPVVFVTSQSDFETRERSGLCGAEGLITKPFLAFEITLSALVLALRARRRKRQGQLVFDPSCAQLQAN